MDGLSRGTILRRVGMEDGMAYHVSWRVVGPGERTLDRDAFPHAFARREDAVAFVLEKLAAFPAHGFDRARGFWGRGALDRPCETRFAIEEHVAASAVEPGA